MPLSDQERIERERLSPRIVQLWRALVPLKTVISFMNTGAHPDDEISAMLAAMSLRDGVDISYACSTRGEGGQNDLGTEAEHALGTLRTAEMERACDILNMRMYWLSEDVDDPIYDFGFSKSGVETLEKWGRERTLKRFVDVIRQERPDIICPTFLDVPGQHGHHRAMTEAAHLVMDLAADPDYTDSDMPPWQVKKLYLPAWSGAGQSYDDDLPPPPTTLTIDASGCDPVTGWSFARIGQQSRACHKTQGMGRWLPAGQEQDWDLHLADSRVDGPDTALSSGLAQTLGDLDVPKINATLRSAQSHLDAAISSFPDCTDICANATKALSDLRQAISACPLEAAPLVFHKLTRKVTQTSHVIRIASEIEALGRVAGDDLMPGQVSGLTVEVRKGSADGLNVVPVLPDGWRFDDGAIHLPDDARSSDPYPAVYLPDSPAVPCLEVTVSKHGVISNSRVALETVPVVAPAYSATVSPGVAVLNIANDRRSVDISVKDVSPEGGKIELQCQPGWTAEQTTTGFSITTPADVAPGAYQARLLVNGELAQSVVRIDYPHVAKRLICKPAVVEILVVNAKLLDVRIGYVGAGNDRVDHWLRQLGAEVVTLSDDDLQDDELLSGLDTLVIGIFALRFRERLAAQMWRLHKWCEQGGTLLTLYHRPWDNWNPDTTPPRHLEIGQPSLRWRVTDEAAPVIMLEPDHPVFNSPNKISAPDWDGWKKERGLYFAKSWDDAYVPLTSMADPQEPAQTGALLVADIGQGRHIHTSLILHHQMEKLVPGAFRIIANLVAKRS